MRFSTGKQTVLTIAALLLVPLPAAGQGHEGGGGSGCGDVFGDLMHIWRDDVTGQPILAQRWVEMPAQEPGYGWGYCPIAVYTRPEGEPCAIPVAGDEIRCEIPYLPFTCDLDPDFLGYVEEVDYFGRLNGGRTKERNNRMHFDEVISNIKDSRTIKVQQDPTGRLMMQSCDDPSDETTCEWLTVDSPMASLGLYKRVMKYGHIATDPYEIDTWAHGDPKAAIQFHPALGQGDWAKFHRSVQHLLPDSGASPENCWDFSQAEDFEDLDSDGAWDRAEPFIDIDKDGEYDDTGPPPEPFTDLNGNGSWDDAEPFTDTNGNGVADEFVFLCGAPEELDQKDFERGAALLAAAADKTGRITVDLVQYANRILKIARKTPHTDAPLQTLPALYRDCWSSDQDPTAGEGDPEPVYDTECTIEEAVIPNNPETCHLGTANWCLYPDLQERFVDFSNLEEYERIDEEVEVILGVSDLQWTLQKRSIVDAWVRLVNGDDYAVSNIDGFVAAASDRVRSIEYVHNYAVPDDLHCKYMTEQCP